MDYRLRHFYGQVANVTVGQTWSTFYDPDVFPDTLDVEGPGILPVVRQPEVRYTLPIQKEAMFASFAIEQPKSDLGNLPLVLTDGIRCQISPATGAGKASRAMCKLAAFYGVSPTTASALMTAK